MSETAELKARAKAQLQGKWGTMALILLIVFGISLIPSGIFFVLELSEGFEELVSNIISAIVTTWSSLTWCGVSLMVARGEPVEVKDMFRVMPRFLSAIWTDFLRGLFLWLWGLLAMVPAILLAAIFDSPLAVWLILPAMIPLVMKSYAYSQTFYVMVDLPDTTGTEPITYSREIMDGHKGELFWLNLTFLGWILLTALTFGLLSFYTTPYMHVTYANFYLEVNGGPTYKSPTNMPAPTGYTDPQWRDMAP